MIKYHALREPERDHYVGEPQNYLQLLGALQRADSTARLKHLIQTYGGVFDATHLCAALARLTQLASYQCVAFLCACLCVDVFSDGVKEVGVQHCVC
jgi:hypothetical protein